MKFIRITGATLMQLADETEAKDLRAAGITDDSDVRINPQGDIEVLQNGNWSIIGGLLGDYAHRIKRLTGLDWN